MQENAVRAILFTRFPEAGKAKTRLIPAVGAEGAASVHRILTERTIKTLRACTELSLEICYTGSEEAAFAAWLGDDLNFVPQPGGDLTARLLAALNPAPVIFFGSDTPDLDASHVRDAAKALQDHDVVIGPAEDGGYYCIGVRAALDFLFTDMPWSTDQVLPETLRRCEARGLTVKLLDVLSDCDTPDDIAKWPALLEMVTANAE